MNRIPSIAGSESGIDLSLLTSEEQAIALRLHDMAERTPNWVDFSNAWRKLVEDHYESVHCPRNQILRSGLYRIGQVLDSKVKLVFGVAQPPGYRDQLLELSRLYASRKQFCEAIGISEDMLSHVIHNRKDFSIASLQQALARIGYTIKLVPVEQN